MRVGDVFYSTHLCVIGRWNLVHSAFFFKLGSLVYTIALGPASVLLGIAFGVVWGNLTRFVPKENDVRFYQFNSYGYCIYCFYLALCRPFASFAPLFWRTYGSFGKRRNRLRRRWTVGSHFGCVCLWLHLDGSRLGG
jgi:hypothetical protein